MDLGAAADCLAGAAREWVIAIREEPSSRGGALMLLGQATLALGRPERAVVMAAAADRLRESVGGGLTVESGRWETEHPRDAAQRLLTHSQIDKAWAQGRTMSLEDAVAYARTA